MRLVPRVGAAAATSLKLICDDCKEHLAPFVDHLLTPCLEIIAIPGMAAALCVDLITSISHLISALPPHRILPETDKLVGSSLRTLTSCIPDASKRDEIYSELCNISAACRYLDPMSPQEEGEGEYDHPVVIILRSMAPAWEDLVRLWSFDSAIVALLCECFEHALKILDELFLPIVPFLFGHDSVPGYVPPPYFQYDTPPYFQYDTPPYFQYDTPPYFQYDTPPYFQYDTPPYFQYDTFIIWNHTFLNKCIFYKIC